MMALLELVDLALLNEIEDLISSSSTIYRQHGLLRAYAYALLEKADELTGASWAHAQYYTDIVWRAENAIPKDYPLLDRHIQNLLSALQWSITTNLHCF